MMKTARSILIALVLATSVSACSTFDGLRDSIAAVVETEQRSTKPDRVRIVPEYVPIPDEFLGRDACPPPTLPSPEEIARMTWEGEYNERVVAPLYTGQEQCYLNNQSIVRFNEGQLNGGKQPE